jgi:hypothetical protein
MATQARVDILLGLRTAIQGSEQALGFLSKFTAGLTVSAVAYKAFDAATDSGRLASEIKNLSAQANLSTFAFQALKHSAGEMGVTQEDLVRGAVTLRKNLEGAAKSGADPLNARLAALNLTAAGLQALAPERQFEVLGQRIAAATDKEEAFAAAMELIGAKSAPKLLEFLQTLGVQGFDKIAESTRKLSLTDAELETLDKAANYWERIAAASKVSIARKFAAVGDIVTATVPDIVKAQQEMQRLESQPREEFQFRLGWQILQLNKARADFVREAIKSADPKNLAAAEDTLAKMVKSGAALEVVADFRKKIRAGQAVNKKTEDTSAAQNTTMSAASLAAAAAEEEKWRASRDNSATENSAPERNFTAQFRPEAAKESSDLANQLGILAEKYRGIADPQKVYRDQIEEINRLEYIGKLSKEEAAAATARLKAEMGRDLERAIDASNDALRRFGESAAALDKNPFLTDVEKHRRRVDLITQENAAIAAQIELLKKFAAENPGIDPAAVRGQIRGLSDRSVRNAGEMGKPDLAAAAAPLEIATATEMTRSFSLAGFSEGGHTGAGGIVHADEWVAPAWMVSHPGFSGVIGSLEASRLGKSPAGAGGGGGTISAAKETRVIVIDHREREKIARLKSDPRFRNVIQDIMDDRAS